LRYITTPEDEREQNAPAILAMMERLVTPEMKEIAEKMSKQLGIPTASEGEN